MTLTAVDKSLDAAGLNAFWAEIATQIKTEVGTDAYERWFREVEAVELDEKALTLRVPNRIFQFWIDSNYLAQLRSVVMLALRSPREIKFVFPDETQALHPVKAPDAEPPTKSEPLEAKTPVVGANGFNPRNNFDAFVVGANNEFAYAACKAVSDAPARTYNPLFIYGGVGLGKTHLMHAIGHAIQVKRKPTKVVYITSEAFTNEFIDAIQNHTLMRFRKRYRPG